jgi:phosphomannomutase
MATTIKFGTDGWRALIAADYTYDNLARVTHATGVWLKTQVPAGATPSAMIGYDCRFNGQEFAQAVANRLAQMGIKVFITPGFSSTPMVSLATAQRQCTAGIVITASHNPPQYSGFKIKGYFGGPAFPGMIADVEKRIPDSAPALEDQFDALLVNKQIEYYDAEALYLNHLKQAFDLEAIHKSGIKIGYDAMYGAGQNVMRRLFPHAHLLHCDYNPSFMGQAPEPIERNLKPFQDLIRSQGLQFGLATDGDADRIGLFDEKGSFVDSHHILLLLIHYLHQYKKQSGKVVSTFSCTGKINQLAAKYGLPTQVTKIGFKYIGEIMAAETVIVGGEESGGIAVAGHIPERDGIYIGLMILEYMAKSGKSLTQLIQEIYDAVGSFAVERADLHLTEAQKQTILAKCKSGAYKAFGSYAVQRTEDLDGFKYFFANDEWVLVRPSGTEPVLRVYAEAKDRVASERILAAVQQTLLA